LHGTHNDNSRGRIRDAMVLYWDEKSPLKFATVAPYSNQHLHFISHAAICGRCCCGRSRTWV